MSHKSVSLRLLTSKQVRSAVVGWASNYGFYIIIDMHAAPFAQQGDQPFTGQEAAAPTDSNPDFYQASQFERGLWFLGNMTNRIHTNDNYRNVGMLEVVNEPVQNSDQVGAMISSYYPNAFSVCSPSSSP